MGLEAGKGFFYFVAVSGQNYLTLLCSDIIFGLRNFRIALKRAVCEKYGQGIRTRDLKYRDNFHSVSFNFEYFKPLQ